MDNKEYLKKFRRCILEYTNVANSFDISEDGDEEIMPDQGGEMDGQSDNQQMGNMQGDETGLEQMPDMGDETNGVDGFQPQGNGGENTPLDGMGSDMQGTDTMNQDDEVIDVDDLTKSQESAEKKIDSMNHKFEKLMGAVETLIKQNEKRERDTADAIAATEKKLADELDKRIPTPQQRMSMRSTKSTPYSISPNEYMSNYAPENYSDEDDNNGVDDAQYQITKNDIDNFTDYASIAKDLDVNNQNLHSILGF